MKQIIIYGGTSAIGVAYAGFVLQRGDALCLVGREQAGLNRVAEDLCVRFDLPVERVLTKVTDFQDNEALATSFAEVVAECGTVDQVLVAHGSLPDQEVLQSDLAQVSFHHQVNYLSAVAICESAATYFTENPVAGAQISVISSVAGDRGRPSNYFYGASKGALSLYLGGLRGRLRERGVSVLTIKPGFVDTPMTAHLEKGPLWAQPEQIAMGILKAEQKGRNVCYLPGFWWAIMFIIKAIPEVIFKRLSL